MNGLLVFWMLMGMGLLVLVFLVRQYRLRGITIFNLFATGYLIFYLFGSVTMLLTPGGNYLFTGDGEDFWPVRFGVTLGQHLEGDRWAGRSVVVDPGVAGDAEDPRRERYASRFICWKLLDHLEEDPLRQILGRVRDRDSE